MEQIIEILPELGLLNEVGNDHTCRGAFAVGAQVEHAPLTAMLLDRHESSKDVEFDGRMHHAAYEPR